MGRTLLFTFRWGIFLLACVFLYAQFAATKGTQALAALAQLRASGHLVPLVVSMLVLMVVNWSIEARKWRWLMAPVEEVGRWRALAATIAGTSVGLVTPNRTGEFLGRVLFLAPHHRVQGGFATALGSIAQFVVTLGMGAIGLLLLTALAHPFPWVSTWVTAALLTLTLLLAVLALTMYLHPALLRQLLLLVPFVKRLERSSTVLNGYATRHLVVVLLLSTLRYMVFTGQFVLLLMVFGAGVNGIEATAGVALVYLLSSLVPTVMLTELGVRGSAAVALFSPLSADPGAVLLATTVLWSINVVLPAIVGSIILLGARIRTAPSKA